MALVDQDNVDVADLSRLVPDSLDAAEKNLRLGVTTAKTSRENASWREWPDTDQFKEVLLN
ncbi:hypothetical protein D3C87_1620200 [compost metagenome]